MNKTDQRHLMQEELTRLLFGNFTFFAFSLMGFFAFMKQAEAPTAIWVILSIIAFIVASLVIRRLHRAYVFYVLTFIYALINSAMLFDTAFRLVFNLKEFTGWQSSLVFSFGVVITLFGFWSQFQIKSIQLRASEKINIRSGRLNLVSGFWNFQSPIHFDAPETEINKTRKLNQLSKLSPIITAFGFAIARMLTGETKGLIFGICMYVLGCTVLWGYAKHPAILFQLMKWERERKILIRV